MRLWLSINQLTGVNMRTMCPCSAVLPELQPAHSCGLPVSVRADHVLPSGPGGEPVQPDSMKEPFYLCVTFRLSYLKENI